PRDRGDLGPAARVRRGPAARSCGPRSRASRPRLHRGAAPRGGAVRAPAEERVPARAAGFDLQISGHTHGGQYFPFNLLVRLFQPFVAGLHRLEAMWLYVSRGTGYWGPPLRLGAPAEITLIQLVRA